MVLVSAGLMRIEETPSTGNPVTTGCQTGVPLRAALVFQSPPLALPANTVFPWTGFTAREMILPPIPLLGPIDVQLALIAWVPAVPLTPRSCRLPAAGRRIPCAYCQASIYFASMDCGSG